MAQEILPLPQIWITPAFRSVADCRKLALERRAKKWNPVFRSPGATKRRIRA